jgi:hypothetical protein
MSDVSVYEASHVKRVRSTRAEIEHRRLALSDSRAKNFGDISVELDAMPPDSLRCIVENHINNHLPKDELKVLKVAEESERELLLNWVRRP